MQVVINIPENVYEHIKNTWRKRRESCPESYIAWGTPLPKGHGRLIDADALYEQYAYADYNFDMTMEYAPTIIEADKEN